MDIRSKAEKNVNLFPLDDCTISKGIIQLRKFVSSIQYPMNALHRLSWQFIEYNEATIFNTNFTQIIIRIESKNGIGIVELLKEKIREDGDVLRKETKKYGG